jgi:periplasmic divalent cation tolerance protein
MELIEIRTRVDNHECAATIAETLVSERLAACAHVRGPLQSWYSWEGSLTSATEWEVDAITSRALFDAVAAHIVATHRYETPAVTFTKLETSDRYRNWVAGNPRTDPLYETSSTEHSNLLTYDASAN